MNQQSGSELVRMLLLVAVVVAAVILVFFAIGYGLGRLLL
jgi:preprotein translocase subunit SecE